MEIINMSNNLENKHSYFNKQESMQLNQNPPSSPPQTTTSPPQTTTPISPSSSPTREFSFTISLHPQPPSTSTLIQPPPPHTPAAIDLSPADEIFSHGHLLPLHFISHLTIPSPRSSTNSMDSFTLPTNLLYDQTNPIGNTSFHCHHQTTFSDDDHDVTTTTQNHPKSKSFSIFSIPKWTQKRSDDETEKVHDHENQNKNKKDLTQLIKRYMKMVKPLLSFPKSKRSTRKFIHQSYSYSGNSLSNKPPAMNKKRGQFSAPASMRTSPANSQIFVGSGTVSPTKSVTSESTMDELHAAIQAAIAHYLIFVHM
ncbi:BRI1 kinase inhibitor 1-like isoform X2 [Rutidosis leptorrhynchoides]|uniref:BRI1 kinase inhibitor 1-like isoform X2 n=1 Tax=Rutidosis leptorrhynchoides TaxID=125765 RepID=UPI003A999243